jgi:hypothetical protein
MSSAALPDDGQDFEQEVGLLFHYRDDDSVHNAMIGAPLPPGLNIGVNAAASKANLKAW